MNTEMSCLIKYTYKGVSLSKVIYPTKGYETLFKTKILNYIEMLVDSGAIIKYIERHNV